jgi:DNA-binding LacI/PurR family transcriptional regulator
MSLTLTKLAKASNVSLSLVSRLMRDDPTLRVSEPTRRRVLATKARLEREAGAPLVVAGRTERPRTFIASLEAGMRQSPSSGTDSFNLYRLLQEIELELVERGHVMAITYCDDASRQKQVEQVGDPIHPVDGVIYLWGHITPEVRQTILDHRVPHVVFHPWVGEYDGLQTIRPLKEESFRMLVNHLVSLGHRRIGHVGCRLRRYPWTAMAMICQGLSLESPGLCALDREAPMQLWSDWRGAAKQHFNNWLDEHPECTAVITENDFVAFGVMDVLESRGLTVGRDLAVASYGNVEPALGDEPSAVLTTVDEQMPIIARRIVTRLLAQFDRTPIEGLHEGVPGKLVIRRSTGENRG